MQLCVPSGFDRRTGSEVSMDHIFFQGVLAAITLVGGGAGDGVVRASAGVSFSSAQGPSLPCSNQGQNQGPRCWSRSSGSWVLSGFFACKGVLAQQRHSPPQWRAEAERVSSSLLVWPGVYAGTVPPGLSEPQAVSSTLPPHAPWKPLPWSHSEALSCVSWLCFLHACGPPLARAPLPQWRAAAVLEKEGLEQAPSVHWGAPCGDYGKLA